MREQKTYDAIFMGSSLTSLAAAAALAKKGKSILVIDELDLFKSRFPTPSFYFALGPLILLGFEEGGAMEGFFSELSLPIPSLRKKGLLFKKTTPLLQVVQSQHRIDLYPQREEYLDELKREFGNQLQQIKSFLEAVEKQGALFYPYLGKFSQLEIQGLPDRLDAWSQKIRFLRAVRAHQKKSAIDFLAPFSLGPDFLKYLDLQSLFAYKQPLSGVSAYQLILLISGFQKGGVRIIGGHETVVNFFLKLIKEWGGEVIQKKRITKLEAGRKKAGEVALEDGSLFVGRHVVVTQIPSGALNFYFTLPNKWIPSPMKESLLMSWGETIPPDVEDILVLRLNLPEEETGFPSGVRGLAVTCLLRPHIEITESRIEDLKVKVLHRLHWLIPFSKSEIQEVGNDGHRERNVFFQALPVKNWQDNIKKVFKDTLSYHQPKEIKNVFLLKNDLSEHLGWGSSFLAAVTLARHIEERLGKHTL